MNNFNFLKTCLLACTPDVPRDMYLVGSYRLKVENESSDLDIMIGIDREADIRNLAFEIGEHAERFAVIEVSAPSKRWPFTRLHLIVQRRDNGQVLQVNIAFLPLHTARRIESEYRAAALVTALSDALWRKVKSARGKERYALVNVTVSDEQAKLVMAEMRANASVWKNTLDKLDDSETNGRKDN